MSMLKLQLIRNFARRLMMGLFLDLSRVRGCCVGMRGSRVGDSGGLCAFLGGVDDIGDGKRRHHRLWSWRCVLGNAIDKKLLSTINKILIDKLSIRSFCYEPTVDKTSFLSTNC
jgi:hypothetical protein